MTERLSTRVVEFRRPFQIDGFDGPQPAGLYDVETTETAIEGLSAIAYQRVSTTIACRTGRIRQQTTINPADLEAAIKKDVEIQNGEQQIQSRTDG